MSKKVQNALTRKAKMQERLQKMQEDIKDLEETAQIELGKFLIKEWDIKDDKDSEQVLEVIIALKDDAKALLENPERDMGKSDM